MMTDDLVKRLRNIPEPDVSFFNMWHGMEYRIAQEIYEQIQLTIAALEADARELDGCRLLKDLAEARVLKLEAENARLVQTMQEIADGKPACCGDPYCNDDFVKLLRSSKPTTGEALWLQNLEAADRIEAADLRIAELEKFASDNVQQIQDQLRDIAEQDKRIAELEAENAQLVQELLPKIDEVLALMLQAVSAKQETDNG